VSSRNLIIALDAGTSLIKVVAFDERGRLIATESRANVYSEGPGGLAEQDMAATWATAATTIAALVARCVGDAVIALAVTGQGDGTWLIDAAGEPVGPAMLWLDGRAGGIVEAFRKTKPASAHFDETNTGLAACHQSSQILWMALHQPERLQGAVTALHCKDFLYFKLTGQRVTDPSEGGFTYGSWRTRRYSERTIAALGLEPHRHLLPPIVDGSVTHHGLNKAAAQLLGLPAGLPVVLGYIDTVCSGLGAGLCGTDDECGVSIIGSTGINMRLAADEFELTPDAPMSGFRVATPVRGQTVLMQSSLAATLNIDWLVEIAEQAVGLAGFAADRASLLERLDQSVMAAAPAQAIYHPYIAAAGERGPFTDATARASLIGVNRSLDLPGMMRSVYEGLALAACDCYDSIGGAPAVITLTGGAARSPAMRKIFAAMLDRKVRIVQEHGSGALGAAMIAAVSLGIMPDIAQCATTWVTPLLGVAERPDDALSTIYAPLLPIYRQARGAMSAFWHDFAAYQEIRL